MANNKPKQTVRERTQSTQQEPKPRRVRQTVSTVAKPVTAAGRGVKKAVQPLSPLAKPFKTRPMRFIGRVLSRVFFINYFRTSWRELKQVIWPGRKETWKLTLAVFAFAIIFGILISLADYGLDKIFHKILL